MTDKESPEPAQAEHSYLDVGPSGPSGWVLALGTLLVGLAVLAGFYGLYLINRASVPTSSPDQQLLTQAAGAATPEPRTLTPSAPAAAAAPTPTLTATATATLAPLTYTVAQGDSLIAIASQLNVNSAELAALNQVSGETIFPGQVLLVPPTVTPWPETGPFPHVVSQGETLSAIAAFYQVTVEELKALNGLSSDTILGGQQLLIPGSGVRPPTPTPTPTPWQPAVITGDLESAYALSTIKGHFDLHVPPDTRAATASETDKVAGLVEGALGQSQAVLQSRWRGRFEVYVAGSLFDAPRTGRRAYARPDTNHLFLLYDGSGTPTERLYFVTFALTHLVAAQALGEAAAPLLEEGLAVYAGERALAAEAARGRPYLSPAQFCAALQAAGQLPRVSRDLSFEGHLGHLDQYFAAGCFVAYLIERDGWEPFAQVYAGGDYRAVYGRTLAQLESDWVAALRAAAADLTFDPDELARLSAEIDGAYRALWAAFEGTPAQFAAYARLDRARLALLQGRLGAAQEHLEMLEELVE